MDNNYKNNIIVREKSPNIIAIKYPLQEMTTSARVLNVCIVSILSCIQRIIWGCFNSLSYCTRRFNYFCWFQDTHWSKTNFPIENELDNSYPNYIRTYPIPITSYWTKVTPKSGFSYWLSTDFDPSGLTCFMIMLQQICFFKLNSWN